MKTQLLGSSILTVGMLFFGVTTTQASTSAVLEMKATIQGACNINVESISFGEYSGGRVTSEGKVGVKCNQGITYAVAINAGLHTDGVNRFMSNGSGSKLAYRLTYAGADWGDIGITNTFFAGPVTGVGNGNNRELKIDAILIQDQAASSGNYTDTVTITVQY